MLRTRRMLIVWAILMMGLAQGLWATPAVECRYRLAPQTTKEKLQHNLSDVDLYMDTFAEALECVQRRSGLAIYVDWTSVEATPNCAEKEVSIKHSSVAAEDLLKEILKAASTKTKVLGYVVQDDLVIVSTEEWLKDKKNLESVAQLYRRVNGKPSAGDIAQKIIDEYEDADDELFMTRMPIKRGRGGQISEETITKAIARLEAAAKALPKAKQFLGETRLKEKLRWAELSCERGRYFLYGAEYRRLMADRAKGGSAYTREQAIGIMTRWAIALREDDEYRKAVKVFEEIFKLDPNNPWAKEETRIGKYEIKRKERFEEKLRRKGIVRLEKPKLPDEFEPSPDSPKAPSAPPAPPARPTQPVRPTPPPGILPPTPDEF